MLCTVSDKTSSSKETESRDDPDKDFTGILMFIKYNNTQIISEGMTDHTISYPKDILVIPFHTYFICLQISTISHALIK